MQQLAANAGIPVQLQAMKSLMQCAFLAAQQPQLLAYSNANPQAKEAAAVAAAQGPAPDDDGDVFLSPCPSPEPAVISDSLREALSRSTGGAGAGAAAAAAAAEAWCEQTGFHLSSVVALGPLFEENQQGPCITRFMQLLLQYHADTAAAACTALQRLQPELRKQQLWVPQHTGGTPSANSSTSTSSSSSEGGYVPAERSRLLVLLMGLYHLQMLEEQQSRQRRQQWEQQQQEREQQWATQQQGSMLQKSQQQDELKQQQPHPQQLRAQQRQHVRLTSSASGDSAAAAAASVYSDTQLCQQFAAAAAERVYTMPDLLAYCLLSLDKTCGVSHGAAQQGANSGSAQQGPQQQQQQQQQGFEVCPVSLALVRDGAAIMLQPPLDALEMPPNVLCDACSPSIVAQHAGVQIAMGIFQPPSFQAAEVFCSACGSAYLCKACGPSSDAWQQHVRCCPALQTALAQVQTHPAAAAGLKPKLGGRSAVIEPCGCAKCYVAFCYAREWQELRLHCNPLLQYAGPWGPSKAQAQAVGSLLPLSLSRSDSPGEAVGLEKQPQAANPWVFTFPLVQLSHEWRRHSLDPESAEAVAARRMMAGSSSSTAAADAGSSSSSSQQGQGGRQQAGSGSSWRAEPPGAAAAAAGHGSSHGASPAARVGVPAGLGSSLAPRRKEQQQRKQQQQQDSVLSRMGNYLGASLGFPTVDDPDSPMFSDDGQFCQAFSEFEPRVDELDVLMQQYGVGLDELD
jgi:hypothetical protein